MAASPTRRKTPRAWLVVFCALGLAAPAPTSAEPPAKLAPAHAPVEISLAVPDLEHRVFAGSNAEIPLRVRGEAGPLRARWYAVTPALRAPLGGAFALELPTPQADLRRIRTRVPEVERESALELRFEARTDAGWAPAGRLRVRAYPADLLEPLRRFAASHPIEVRDAGGALSRFLRAHEVSTWQGGDGWSSSPAVIVHLGEDAGEPDLAADGAWHLVLDAEAPGRLPYVVVEPGPKGGRLRVPMRLVERLEHDPQAQSALVEIFALLQEHRHERGTKR